MFCSKKSTPKQSKFPPSFKKTKCSNLDSLEFVIFFLKMRFDNEVTLRVNSESIINRIFQQVVDSVERVVSAIVFEEHFSTVLMFFFYDLFSNKMGFK